MNESLSQLLNGQISELHGAGSQHAARLPGKGIVGRLRPGIKYEAAAGDP